MKIYNRTQLALLQFAVSITLIASQTLANGTVETNPDKKKSCLSFFGVLQVGIIETKYDEFTFPARPSQRDLVSPTRDSQRASTIATTILTSEQIAFKQEIIDWAQKVKLSKNPAPNDRKMAKFILREFTEQELQDALSVVSVNMGKRNTSEIIMKDPEASPENLLMVLAEMRLITHAMQASFDRDIGRNEDDPNMDQVMKASARGNLTWEFARNKEARAKATEILKVNSSASHDLQPVVDHPLVKMFNNITQQIQNSKLFLGFEMSDIFGGSTQYLKIKPYSQWSEAAKKAMQATYRGSMADYEIARVFDNVWINGIFPDPRIASVNGVNVVDFIPESHTTYQMSNTGEKPFSSNYLQQLANQARQGNSEYQYRATLNSAGVIVKEHQALRRGHVLRGMGSGFVLPLEIVDWNSSVFAIDLSRKIPSNSLAIKSHRVMVYFSKMGQEALVESMTSGEFSEAARTSGLVGALPRVWNQIPSEFRTIPTNLEEMKAYTEWVGHQRFNQGGTTQALQGPSDRGQSAIEDMRRRL